jgi:methionyl-tRNA synthetase
MAKDPTRRGRLGTVLYHLLEVGRLVSVLLWPFMPSTAHEISRQLGTQGPGRRGDLESLGRWGGMEPGKALGEPKPLFPRVDPEEVGMGELSTASPARGDTKTSQDVGVSMDEIAMEDFQKMDLRVGKVLSAEALKGSDRLLRLRVDTGGGERQLIAGIATHYAPDALVGKSVVVLANLKPAKIFGQLSQGMVLAAVDEEHVRVLTVDGEVSVGAKIR